jgi:P27 family predicted phage terminase small subunit
VGKRGPKRRSNELAEKLGNPGKVSKRALGLDKSLDSRSVHASGTTELRPDPAACAPPPAWLSEPAQEIWRVIAADLSARHCIKSSDEIALARYCETLSMWLSTRKELFGRSMKSPRLTYTIVSNHGTRQAVRPEVAILRGLDADLRSYEGLFGLSPAARVSLVASLAEIRDDVRPPMHGRVVDRSLPPGMPQRPANPLDALDALGGATPPKPASPIGLLAASSSRKTH